MTRVLMLGAAGQLGRALSAALRPDHEVIETVRHHPEPGQHVIDLADPDGVAASLETLRPEWIIVAGAWCNVDGAETNRETCVRVNVEGPRAAARYAQASGGRLVYYSSDFVFDGSRPLSREQDPLHPLNVYGQSKMAGEEAVRRELPDRHVIVRTTWMYGVDRARKNFVCRLLDELSAGRPMGVPSDLWGTPTYTEDMVAATRALLKRGVTGTVHAVGPQFMSRLAFARLICEVFELDPSGLVPKTMAELRQPARRPSKVRLDCPRLQELGIDPFRGPREGLLALRERLAMVQEVGR